MHPTSTKDPLLRSPNKPIVLNAALVARIHTYLAYTAFLTALVVACLCHYKKVVKNSIAGYPEEWFPSVSATIGDWYPERNIFQILIALTAGPRFGLVLFQYYLHYPRRPAVSTTVFIFGVIRTLSCGGWVYITSSDDHDVHDAFMITYMVFLGPKVLTVPNMPPVQGQPMESVTPDGVATEKITSPNVQDVNRNQTILNLFPLNLSGMRPALSFLSDVYLSYIFWSIFTSLIPTLFYFSVWELGLAGQELALLSTLSPVFLGIGPLSRWAQSRDGQTTLHLMECLGLLAFALGSPVLRLVAVASAAAVAVLRQVAKWSADEGREWLSKRALMFFFFSADGSRAVSLGCLVAALLKQFNHSNNPLWPFVDNKKIVYNAAGLALTFIAIYETHTRPTTISSTPAKEKAKVQSPSVPSWFTAALPLGSLLFTIHNLVSDPSTLIAWSWTGYQNGVPRGPVPHLHGALTLIAQCAGLFVPILLVPSNAVDLLTHPVWFIFGTLMLGRAVHAAKGGAIKVFGVAMGVYCLFNLASIFTVAYAFVPGGVYFRERTDWDIVSLAEFPIATVEIWPEDLQRWDLDAAPYKFLAEDGKVHDIDEEDEDRWCEYIFYRGLYRTSYARISRGSITDTELQIGQFALPKHGTGVTNETRPARYLRSHKETLPEHHWFPMEYYGDENQGGVNGHFYHVFMTPLYYDLPENAVL
ncbi:hypothetical protein C0989_009279 [Termitomyces sp. Mn162]|nr:hypothetical protein C0989_009279 [Termitomyces sp. Mn162]